MGMFSREIATSLFERTRLNSTETVRPSLDETMAVRIAEMPIAAKRSIIRIGGGVLLAAASEELRAWAEFLEIPVSRPLIGRASSRTCIP
jgi:acetolactate synthase-1/2/3 large subunit